MTDDLISRSMVLLGIDRNISNMRKTANGDRMANKAIDLVQITRDFIANHPAAVAERSGRWVFVEQRFYHGGFVNLFRCSECSGATDREHNYCPNCGAKMEA